MIKELRIEDMGQFIEITTQIDDEQKYRMWYRGQSDYSWGLVPSVQRSNNTFMDIQCLSPAKKYKLYKSSINKSLHFAQRRLSSSTRGQSVTAQLNLSRE